MTKQNNKLRLKLNKLQLKNNKLMTKQNNKLRLKLNKLQLKNNKLEKTYVGLLNKHERITKPYGIITLKDDEICMLGKVYKRKDIEDIIKAAVNLGMTIRQNQLNGSDTRSGNEILAITLNTDTLFNN